MDFSFLNSGNGFSFGDTPIFSDTMFADLAPKAPLPLAVNPAMADVYNMQNGIMPGEWDWMKGASSGLDLSKIQGVAEMLMPKPQQQLGAPSVSGNSPNSPNVSGLRMTPKLTEWIQRKPVAIPRIGG